MDEGRTSQLEGPASPILSEPPILAATEFLTLKRIGWFVLAVQFFALAGWKTFMFSRFSGTFDETIYQQGVFLISRGHFDPVATIKFLPLIRDHATVLVWLLAPLDWIPPTGLFFLLASVAAVVWAELIAFNWICFLIERWRKQGVSLRLSYFIGSLGIVLLVANPWTWWAISWDFHVEELGAPLIIAAAFEFSRRRFRIAWIWVAALALTGDIGSTWILGLCLSALLASYFQKEARLQYAKTAGILLVVGIAEVIGLSALGLSQGSNLSRLYGYLTVPAGHFPSRTVKSSTLVKSLLLHPIRAATVLVKNRVVFTQNLAPTGFLGVITLWTFGVPIVILVENTLTQNFFFGFPGFQSLPVYTFTPVGICSILLFISSKGRHHNFIVAICATLMLNCVAWEAVFLPHLKGQWVLVSQKQASILSRVDSKIPRTAEVIASQGIISRFSFRKYVYTDFIDHDFRIHNKLVYFVLAPTSGIEGAVDLTEEEIGQLSSLSYSHLVVAKDGIYVFRLELPTDMKELDLPPVDKTEAWLDVGAEGKILQTGSSKNWEVGANGSRGYVVSGDYWPESRGDYRATVVLSDSAPVSVEIWNDDSNTLIAREQLTPNPTIHEVTLDFKVANTVNPRVAYSGAGYFSVQWNPLTPDPKNQFEIRVYNATGAAVTVSLLSISKI
jgi:hypothetical protein